jgi:sugar phosphate isomerase/epimerase
MKLSVFTASTPDWTAQEAAQTLAAQGWDGVEWRIVDQGDAAEPGFWAGNRTTWPLTGLEDALPELVRVTKDAGLQVSGLGGYAAAADHENAERMLRAAAFVAESGLGHGKVRVTMPRQDSGSARELVARTRDDLAWVAERAAALGVTALVELHHETISPSASAALRLIEGLDPAAVGVIHDLGNLVIEGWENPAFAFDLLGPYLAHVHVKNAVFAVTGEPADGSGGVAWRNEWAPLREGQGDVLGYLRALVAAGYDGWITLEDFSTERPLAERTADNLAYMSALLAEAGASRP